MKNYSIQKAIRPKNIYNRGIVVSIDQKNLDWLDKLLHKYCDPTSLRKLVKHLPNIGAIEVLDGDLQNALMVISKRSNPGQFRIDHYSGTKIEADFSLLMICEKDGINVKDLTPNINPYDFKQVANFVIAIHMYEFLMKTDKSVKRDIIVPIEIFGEPLA